MKKFAEKEGRISLIELLAIAVLVCEFFYLVPIVQEVKANHIAEANDEALVEKALDVAFEASEQGKGSPINNCSEGQFCSIKEGNGLIGYYDAKSNTIVDKPVKGYNEYGTEMIDGRVYVGEPGTLIIKVRVDNGEIVASWIKGA